MSESDFRLSFDYPVPVSRLYEQFATAEGVRHWWTENCEMEEKIGGLAKFPFPDAGFHAAANIVALDADRCIEWRIIECQHPPESGWVDLSDWVGTSIRFETHVLDDDRSRLEFTHEGLITLECMDSCSSLWRFYLNESLRDYLVTGTGQPYQDGQSRNY